MFRVLNLVRRADGWDAERFHMHWRTVHAPLVARVPGLRSYRISRLAPDLRGEEPPWDGIAELVFDDRAAYLRARQTTEYQAAIADDQFLGRRQQLLADETHDVG